MRKIILFTVSAFLLSASFTTNSNKAVSPAITTPKPAEGVSFHIDETNVSTDVLLFLCNGDQVNFPEFSVREDIHGVINNNVSVAQGKRYFTGTGVSLITGEVYTLNDVEKFSSKEPIINGAAVINDRYVGVLTGDQGSKDNFIAKFHLTINARGEMTALKNEFEGDCQ